MRSAMAMSVCPATTVAAPVERVWALLADPAGYERWIEAGARVERVEPLGPVQAGQRLVLSARALGWRWRLTLDVRLVDEVRHRVQLDVALPLGIRERTTVTCTPVDERSCYVQYG